MVNPITQNILNYINFKSPSKNRMIPKQEWVNILLFFIIMYSYFMILDINILWINLTHYCLIAPLEIVVWNGYTFGNNFRIKCNFTIYLKESCW